MIWTTDAVDRLFQLYQSYERQLRADLVRANVALGATVPESKLPRLGREEFVALLRNSDRDPEVAHAWIQGIVRGHESEFSDLEVA